MVSSESGIEVVTGVALTFSVDLASVRSPTVDPDADVVPASDVARAGIAVVELEVGSVS